MKLRKLKEKNSAIALNSSYPKDKIYISDQRITEACRNCEAKEWKEKDFFYIIGQVKKGILNNIIIVEGACYCANPEVYKKLYDPLKEEIDLILSTGGFEKGKTMELGKIKRIDPLGITDLRIRGMWDIQNPFRVFSTILQHDETKEFSLHAILTKEKYISFPNEDKKDLENKKSINIKDVRIKNPNNPSRLIEAKLITFSF